jgi:hypothetical protein
MAAGDHRVFRYHRRTGCKRTTIDTIRLGGYHTPSTKQKQRRRQSSERPGAAQERIKEHRTNRLAEIPMSTDQKRMIHNRIRISESFSISGLLVACLGAGNFLFVCPGKRLAGFSGAWF